MKVEVEVKLIITKSGSMRIIWIENGKQAHFNVFWKLRRFVKMDCNVSVNNVLKQNLLTKLLHVLDSSAVDLDILLGFTILLEIGGNSASEQSLASAFGSIEQRMRNVSRTIVVVDAKGQNFFGSFLTDDVFEVVVCLSYT